MEEWALVERKRKGFRRREYKGRLGEEEEGKVTETRVKRQESTALRIGVWREG